MKERIEPLILEPTDTIREALESMERGKEFGAPAGIVIVTKPGSNKVKGVVTDGDIRRALVSGSELDNELKGLMSRNPFRIQDSSGATQMLKQVHKQLDEREVTENKYQHIIIVDEHDEVLDVVTPFELWKQSEVRINTATVVGLGYVGLTLALTLADNDITVHGIEKDERKLESLENGSPHFFERGLESLLDTHLGENFHVSKEMDDIDSDIFIMCVNTPVTDDGNFDASYVETAAKEIGSNIEIYDIVIIRSTVPVGTCRNTIIPILESESNMMAGQDFFVAYAPERTVAGNALEELKTLPQVIGGYNQRSLDYASQVFQLFSKNTVPVSSLETAEMVKLLNNCYRDLIFSFANEAATLCEYWDLDAHEVIKAANRGYSRNEIPKPSPGVGGPCLTKDPYILSFSGEKMGYEPHLPKASRNINENMIEVVARKISRFIDKQVSPDTPILFIMGMAYKGQPETSDIRNSPSVELLEVISQNHEEIRIYDPVASRKQLESLEATVVEQPEDGFKGANCTLVMTNHASFTSLNISKLTDSMADPGLLFDPWSLYNEEGIDSQSHIQYDRFSSG